jgi:hypothetical protein
MRAPVDAARGTRADYSTRKRFRGWGGIPTFRADLSGERLFSWRRPPLTRRALSDGRCAAISRAALSRDVFRPSHIGRFLRMIAAEMSLLIRHARILTLAQPATTERTARARRGPALRELGIVARADVLVAEGKIAAVGTDLTAPAGAEVIDADGRVLMPGFVDCHTHACWAGEPLDLWEQQLGGGPKAEQL